MRVLVIGAGYVGLTTASVLAQKHQVTILDVDSRRIDKISGNESPIFEEGLDDLMSSGLETGNLVPISDYDFDTKYDIVMICVGTPPNKDGSSNLSYIESVVAKLDKLYDTLFNEYPIIALRSTVSPGTTRHLVFDPLRAANPARKLGVVYSPEFLAQGRAIYDLFHPDRIVVGSTDDRAAEIYLKAILSCTKDGNTTVRKMSLESAELCKLASNYFLATKISFANELAALAERIQYVDIDDVLLGVSGDRRIHPSHLGAGLGFGGSCFPKDTSGLLSFGHRMGIEMQLLDSVIGVNEGTHSRLVKILESALESIEGVHVSVLGLTFKAGTDDTRSSPSIALLNILLSTGCNVNVHDPQARKDSIPEEIRDKINYFDDPVECTRDTEAVFMMTDWKIYIDLGIEHLTNGMKRKLVIDGRRMFARDSIPSGIEYRALGSFYGRSDSSSPDD